MTPVVPISDWSHDHWNMLRFIGAVDSTDAPVDITTLRLHPRWRIPGQPYRATTVLRRDPDEWTTILAYQHIDDHDDLDCAVDLDAAGAITWDGTGLAPIWKLTSYGRALLSYLDNHKGNFVSFEPPPM